MGKNKKKKQFDRSIGVPTFDAHCLKFDTHGAGKSKGKKNQPWICWCEVTDATKFGLFNVKSHCEECSPSNTDEPIILTGKELKRRRTATCTFSNQEVVNFEEKHESKLMSLLYEIKGSSTSTSCTENNQLKLITDICTDQSSEVLTDHKIHGDNTLDHQLYCELKNKEENAYGLHQQMLNFRRDLPAYKMKKDILDLIDRNQVSLISGETGCGKTTQVAQFILDEYVKQKRGSTCHIICTQPRRISAVSVAERVAHERDEKLGKSCGYRIRLEAAPPRKQGSVLFCTPGVLLRFMINDLYVSKASHIIIDEVHERDTLTDYLLIIIKTILQRRADLKIILMSATLNAETFSNYFEDCPTLNIPGRTHPVEEYFLEDIFGFIDFHVELKDWGQKELETQSNRQVKKSKKKALKKDGVEDFASYLSSIEGLYSSKIIQSLSDMDFSTIPYDLIIKIVSYICQTSQDGAILIFLSGWKEIEKMMKRFSDEIAFKNRRQFIILPIHSKLNSVSQKEVFEKPPPGCRKIIVGTNIVETSVTIDDVVYVIDTGKAKENTYDPLLNISSLQSSWVSKASLTQRLGRAGRVQPGKCYRLFTKHHKDTFEEYQVAEMLRIPLEQLCLSTKILKCGQVWPFLSKAVEPPTQKACEIAIQELVKMQALDADENLTSLGYYLALLPVAPKIGRMMIIGAIFSCLDPVLTIAASLESKDPSSMVQQDGTGAYSIKKEKFAHGKENILAQQSKSDHIVLLKEIEGWERLQGDYKAQASYCREHRLENNILRTIVGLKKQFTSLLQEIGFVHSSDPKDQSSNRNSLNTNLIKAVLCAGLYPNVAKIAPEHDRKVRYKRKRDAGDGGAMSITRAFFTPEQRDLNHGNNPHLYVHPSSSAHKFLNNECHWLVYHELLKIEKCHNLFDITVVSPYPLLFFGGLVKYNGVDTIEVDGEIKFHASPKTAQIILDLREQLDRLLNEKINNPSMRLIGDGTIRSDNEKILQAIIDLISTEKVQSKMEFNAAAAPADKMNQDEDEDDDNNDDEDDGVVTEEKEGFNSSNFYTSSGTQSSFSAQRPPTQSSFSAQRPPIPSRFSAQRPPTQSSFSAQRPQTQSSFSAQRLPTQSGFSAQRPPTQSSFSAQRPPTQSNFYAQRPPTQSSFYAQRPPTQSSFYPQRPPTQSSFYAERPPTQSSFYSQRPRPPVVAEFMNTVSESYTRQYESASHDYSYDY